MSIGREIEDIARDLIKHQHDHPPVRDLNREFDRKLKLTDRIASDFARLVGSWVFVLAQLGLMLLWVLLNVIGAIRLLMALNSLADRDRLRAQSEYELNVKAEEELKALMNHLMHQDEILLQIVNRLDRGDREMKRLARRLEQALEPSADATRPQPPPHAPPQPPPALAGTQQPPPPAAPVPSQPERPLGLPIVRERPPI